MREFERKRIIKNRVYSKFTTLILLVVLGFLVSGTLDIYEKANQSEKQLDLAAARLAKLEEQQISLENKIETLQSEVGIEEQIRSRFYLAKEGERAVFIIDQEPETEPEQDPRGLRGFWRKTVDFFGF